MQSFELLGIIIIIIAVVILILNLMIIVNSYISEYIKQGQSYSC